MAKRESIIDDIVTDLNTIATGSGYNNTIGLVMRGIKPVWQLSRTDFPAAMIVSGDMPIASLTNTEHTTGASLLGLDGWIITIKAFVKTVKDFSGAGTTWESLEGFIEDIIECLDVDRTRGQSYVIDTKPDSISRFVDSKKSIGMADISFSIKYDWQHDSF